MTDNNETARSSRNRILENKAAVVLLEIQVVTGNKPFELIKNKLILDVVRNFQVSLFNWQVIYKRRPQFG